MARTWDVERVANGEGRPGVAELVALIHRVNPTDRGLGDAERARRYALKAKLQSRLVREWSEHLEVALDPRDPEVVSLVHRGHARDAAHVPRASLDPEARAIVDRILAFGHDAPSSPVRSVEAAARDDRLSRAREAMEGWDYDAAEALLREDLAERPGEAGAFALVDLLVETLARDADALALRLPERVFSPRVSRLLALAAARTGSDRVNALMERLDRPGQVDVRLILADRAVRAGDERTARVHLGWLQELDPANGAVIRLADAVDGLVGAALAPLEAALAAARDPVEVRRAAQKLLAVSPANNAARGALARLEAAERAAEATRLIARAEGSESAGRLDLALADLEHAETLSPGSAGALPRVREALRRARDEARIAAAQSDLATYVELPDALRAEVRRRWPSPRLERLERFRDQRDPVRALLALERAEQANAVDAIADIDEAGLTDHPLARPLVRAARATVAAEERREAAALAARILESSDAEALELAAHLRVGSLDADLVARVEAFVAAARAREDEARDVATFDEAMRTCSPFHARMIARARAASPVWRRRLEAVDRHMLGLFVPRRIAPWRDDLRDVASINHQLSADACVEPDGRHAWLAECVGHECYVRRFEVATSRVVEMINVRAIDPISRPRVAVFGNRIWLCGAYARILGLELGPDGGVARILCWVEDLRPVAQRADVVDVGRDPDFRPLFRDIGTKDGEVVRWCLWQAGVDAEGSRFVPSVDVLSAHPVNAPGAGPRLMLHKEKGQVHLWDPATDQNGPRLGYAHRLDSAAPMPDGSGWACVGSFPPTDSQSEADLGVLNGGRGVAPVHRVPLGPLRSVSPITSSRESGLVYVLTTSDDESGCLRAYDCQLRLVWELRDRGLVHLLTDVADRWSVALFQTERGPVFCPLGRERPVPPPDTVWPTFGWRQPWGVAVPDEGDARAPRPSWPAAERVRDAIRAADAAPTPEERFAALDHAEIWEIAEIQSMARIGEAALDATSLHPELRMHAIASFFDAGGRWKLGPAHRKEVPQLPDRWPDERITAVHERARAWLIDRARDRGWQEVTREQPRWTSSADWTD